LYTSYISISDIQLQTAETGEAEIVTPSIDLDRLSGSSTTSRVEEPLPKTSTQTPSLFSKIEKEIENIQSKQTSKKKKKECANHIMTSMEIGHQASLHIDPSIRKENLIDQTTNISRIYH